jgi:hypothetical protein
VGEAKSDILAYLGGLPNMLTSSFSLYSYHKSTALEVKIAIFKPQATR